MSANGMQEVKMDTIVLEPNLRVELEKNAEREHSTVNDLVNEAVKRFLREQRAASLRDEIQAYFDMHAQLKRKYLGEWVAIYRRELVDHDADTAALYKRVRAAYGNAPVLLREVEPEADPEIQIRTPNTGRVTP